MKNIEEFFVGRAGSVNNAGWLSGAAVIYKVKLENGVLYFKGVDNNKKIVSESSTDVKKIRSLGKEDNDIYYIDIGNKKISMHVVEENKNQVEELINILKESGISDSSKRFRNRSRVLYAIYSIIIIAFGILIFMAR
ncbi:MAG: hypothetical protein ACRDA5_12460 [Clostridium sp.]